VVARGDKPLLKVAEAARLLRLSRSAVYRGLQDGRIPGFKVIGQWRLDQDELDAWITAERPTPSEVAVPTTRSPEGASRESFKKKLREIGGANK
jgi:excisionase family DNA binding protein